MDLSPSDAFPVRAARKLLAQNVRVAETVLGHAHLGGWVGAEVFHSPVAY